MAKFNIAISLRTDLPHDQMLFGSGLSQNVKFFYDLFKVMGYKPYLLTDKRLENDSLRLNGKPYRTTTHDEILQSTLPFPLIFEAGVTVGRSRRAQFRESTGSKIISLRYGHSMYMDMEQMCHPETLSPGLYEKEPDFVWASPHFKIAYPYLATIYNAPVRECPYIWEPDFVANPFGATDYRETPDIYVMEPNISVLKNALIPLAVIENLYRRDADSFGTATILNGLHYNDRKYFLSNIVKNLSSLIAEANKVYFAGRNKFNDVFKKRDILLGHQMGCELNYLYFEALWKGIPLVHNSPALEDVGYYYPECDVFEGRDQCLKAIRDRNVTASQRKNKAFVRQYSIHNKSVQNQYKLLIDEAIESK
jgi:hypothetical protein